MIRSIADDIRYQFQTGNTITRLIIVNVAIFLFIMLFQLVLNLSAGFTDQTAFVHQVVSYLFLSQDLLWDLKHPWTLITNMFTHIGLLHLVFNMLVLYWFGRIAGDLLGDHRMLPLYIYSGLCGALLYLITAPLMYKGGSDLHGASGAIMGIVAAAGMTAPDYQVRLLFFGDVRLKYIVLALILISFVGIANLDNAGGHMAHLGGAAFGFFYVHMLRQGYDMTRGFRRLLSFLKKPRLTPPKPVKRKVPMEIRQRSPYRQRDISSSSGPAMGDQERLDYILDKIKQSGISSLDEDEKKFLDDASQKK
ncbi:MAG TPA: rhomboid family intramembrane serine protease [Saprospiraceae bacterium]|nr:rhomboid family intramembrane serine protease [Saprospiraceae bacterium]